MPIYEYDCQKCGTFETTQKITEKPLSKCPTCKGKVKKLISNTSFQLKGTGWYVTDYARKDNNKGAGKGENGAKPSAESKSDSKGDSKGESKTESSSSGSAKPSSTSSSSTSA
jgi:putative FmdB family regulatory protein